MSGAGNELGNDLTARAEAQGRSPMAFLLHALNHQLHCRDTDPFALFAAMSQKESIEPAHAFYLGYELAKAVTAIYIEATADETEARERLNAENSGTNTGRMGFRFNGR